MTHLAPRALAEIGMASNKDTLRAAIKKFDLEGNDDGYINEKELKKILCDFNKGSTALDDDTVSAIMAAFKDLGFDKNGDGKFSIDEVVEALSAQG